MTDRRSFLLAAPFFVRELLSKPPSSTVRLAAFGANGMAFETLDSIASHPKVKLIAVAEVDSNRLDKVKQKYPEARLYQDWREMLKKERGQIDAASVGTPDHMHAPQAISAMRMGLPVYVQKPLAHDIHEVRTLMKMARAKKLPTQMGIQIHSWREYKTAVSLIQSGAIGKVKEVHTWSEKKWGDTAMLPATPDPVPDGFNWDLWLGVAAVRPFLKDAYHPGNWRKRLDFGTATFGDMGCHILDPVFGALQLGSPITVRSEGAAPNTESWALDTLIRYVFAGTPFTSEKTVPVTWYDGDRIPPEEIRSLLGAVKFPGQGSIFIGTKGQLLLPHIKMPVLLPEQDFSGFAMPEFERTNHYHEFAEAVLGNGQTSAGFDFAGPLTEAVLLGPLATHFPNTTLAWHGPKAKFANSAEANALLRRKYRAGWSVPGLA
ncbi:MAG TPA: Gfo/Idh/MocA family oxidoreductase [Bryobacteraceae bacterium]|jgi:predicted dehydrogenase|nr:Gfo/Idh/MocA family oxidoreductase [Bryobacteraceae bacterium]